MSFIQPKQLYTYFSNEFSLKKTSKGWHAFKCPVCNELEDRKKMAVNFNYGVVKCWVCGYQEHAIDFVAWYEGTDFREARKMLNECTPAIVNLDEISEDNSNKVLSEIKLPYGFVSLLDGYGFLGVRARNYLKGRGFNLKDMDRMGVGYCNESPPDDSDLDDYFGYIIIPFKQRGKLVYYIGRDFVGNFLRYKNPPKEVFDVGKGDLFFNEDALFLYDEVFLLEGWADAYTIGRNAIASLGWKLSKTQIRKIVSSDIDTLVLVPDAGVDGQGVSFYMHALMLALEIVKHKKVKVIDLNAIDGGKDVNEIGREQFMELYKECSIMAEDELMLKYLNYECTGSLFTD